MSLIFKILKSLKELESSKKQERFYKKNFSSFKSLKKEPLPSDDELIMSILNTDKRLNNLKTTKGKKNSFCKMLIESSHIMNYKIFSNLCVFFGYEYDLIDFIAVKEMNRFLGFDSKKINYEKSVFLQDRTDDFKNYDLYFRKEVEEKYYDEAALMVDKDFIDYYFSLIKKEAKKKSFKHKIINGSTSLTYYYLKKFISEKEIEKVIKLRTESHFKYINENSNNCGTSYTEEKLLSEELALLNGENLELRTEINESNWLNYLNGKLENSLVEYGENKARSRSQYNFKIIYRSLERNKNKNIYNKVLVLDQNNNIITSANTLILSAPIEDVFKNEINEKTTYKIKNIKSKKENTIHVELKDNDNFKVLKNISEMFANDDSLMISQMSFKMSLSNDEALISFICSRFSGRDNQSEFLKKLEKEFSMLGELRYQCHESRVMPTYEEYYYKLKINSKTILDHIENVKPTPRLESGKRYEVVETSKGMKKGTIFKYIGFKDIWRQELIIEHGFTYDKNGNEKECFNELIALHNGNASMIGAQNGTIPKCKLLS